MRKEFEMIPKRQRGSGGSSSGRAGHASEPQAPTLPASLSPSLSPYLPLCLLLSQPKRPRSSTPRHAVSDVEYTGQTRLMFLGIT